MRNQLLRDTDWASITRIPLKCGFHWWMSKLLSQLALDTAARSGSRSKRLLANSPAVPTPPKLLERGKTRLCNPYSILVAAGQAHPSRTGFRRLLPISVPGHSSRLSLRCSHTTEVAMAIWTRSSHWSPKHSEVMVGAI